ncbi:hypothetical protein C7C46_11940 [Streptomyces tateyamensis]|uniref:Uncharacterized protein n=1 Tax=Streptomyces tateyamensis TaxID=565073 RepID=A0A2V4NVJ7_9ACTN|nr:hypothetical protein [Streptomyces tateyamensis]PYC80850.1 hypothetical protein C7C46_11940 [Streptomyces tateyamensis]
MDVDAASALTQAVSAVAGAAGTAVGKQAWEALQQLAKRAYQRARPGAELDLAADAPVDPADAPVDPADEEQVRVLTGTLIARYDHDPELARDLAGWLSEHAGSVRLEQDSTVTNVVSENARVAKLIQGRDFHGTINL